MGTRISHPWDLQLTGRALHVDLREPASVVACYDLIDEVDERLSHAEVVVLEGPGWITERTRKTARLIHEIAVEHGAEFRAAAPSLASPP